MAQNDRPSFDEIISGPIGKELTECAKAVRAVAARLEEIAWTVSVREIGRTVAHLGNHFNEDAQRLDVLAMLVPSFESLPPEKKAEITEKFEQRDREKQ
jgi:hypothetical protein